MNIFKIQFSIEHSIEINAPIDVVWEKVFNFKEKQKWSPRYILEPNVEIKNSGDNKVEEWEGKVVGSGKQTITDSEEHSYVNSELEFYKPMKSSASNSFKLTKLGDNVKVTWKMVGYVPFFLFFMKPMIKSFIGMDFERGLVMLKEICETGKLETKQEVIGVKQFEKQYYIGMQDTCYTSEMQESMKKTFGGLWKLFEEKDIKIPGNAYTEYIKSDLVKNIYTYRACFPVSKELYDNLEVDDKFVKDSTPEFKAHVIRHLGDYKFLGNAWSFAFMYPKSYKIPVTQKKPPIEVYIIGPHNEKDPTKYKTDIYVPMK